MSIPHWSRTRLLYLASWALLALPVSARVNKTGARVEPLAESWRFAKGPQPGAETPGYDDSAWQSVRVPHDWAIAGPYDPLGNAHTAKLPWKGEGWYRRHWVLSELDRGKRVYVDFDGVMAMPTIYLNGERVGAWDYGYTSFRVDVTSAVRFGQSNVLAVHVDTRSHHSRWYPGAGIYRKVALVVREPVHVAYGGSFVSTPEVNGVSASVRVQTTVENHGAEPRDVEVHAVLRDPDGTRVGVMRSPLRVPAAGQVEVQQLLEVPGPRLWELSSPELYDAEVEVVLDGKVMDLVHTPFGIRTIEFKADDGFHLNGHRVQLQGVNLHHDQGPLGAAFSVRAAERQLQIMQEMGVNAIRTSHNPPAPEFLDLCDRMGFLVFDEVFDKWDQTATLPQGRSIAEHAARHIEACVRRDRNHPSVIVWSVGNEVWDLEGNKLEDGPGLVQQMVSLVKRHDPTRPATLAFCVPESALTPISDSLDVASWNYARRYANSRRLRPQLPIIYSESASAYSTRGYYHLPHPKLKTDYPLEARISSYDLNSADYSDLVDSEFALMQQDAFVAGEFVWTGFDYLGEPVPYVSEGWGSFKPRHLELAEESRISSFGIVDLVGIPKDRYYLYRSHWAPERATVHLLPHWTWPEHVGKNVPVYVYTNGDSAELFLNGRSLGKRVKQPDAGNLLDRYRLRWEEVIYTPGELRAVAYRAGQRVGEATVRTAGNPKQLKLTPDRRVLSADGDDLSYVLVEALDEQGNLCPLAMHEVGFRVEGAGSIAGVGNGDHHFAREFVSDRVTLFYGKAMLLVRSASGKVGTISVRAESQGLKMAAVELQAR